MQDSLLPISGNSFRVISMAFYSSIDNNDADIFQSLNSFLYDQIYENYEADNLPVFEKFSYLYPYCYEYVLQKKANSVNYRELYEVCVERTFRDVKQKIGFPYTINNEELTLADKENINAFSSVMINRMGDILHICLRHKDFEKLPLLLNQLDNVRPPFHRRLSELKYELMFSSSASNKTPEEIEVLKREFDAENFTESAIRLLIKAGLYWCYFLFNMRVYNIDDLRNALGIFDGYKRYIEVEFVPDLIILRSSFSESRYSWGNWDYMKRMEGSWSPPSVANWVTQGAIYYLLRGNGHLAFDLQQKRPDELNGYEYVASAMLEILNNVPQGAFQSLGGIIGADSEFIFKESIERLKQEVLRMKQYVAENKEHLLSQQHLHKEYVDNFKNAICEAWSKGNVVQALFKYFDKIERVKTTPVGTALHYIGIKNSVWEGYKKFLIESEDLSGRLFGFESAGSQIAEQEENAFFSSIASTNHYIVKEPFSGIDQAIENLTTTGAKPSVIMIGLDLWYRYLNSASHEGYEFSWNKESEFPLPNYGGTYRKIPIVKFRSPMVKNDIIVADFKLSFLLRQKKQPNGFEEVLINDITEIDVDKAESIINENESVWTAGTTREAAKIKLINSILVNIYLNESFIIQNERAFAWLTLNDRYEGEEIS